MAALASFRGAVPIQRIANRIGSDPRTVRHHLSVMAMYHRVIFLNPEKSIVAKPSDLRKLLEKEEERRERDELVYWSATSGGARRVWSD